MSKKEDGITRRDFIRGAGAALVVGAAAGTVAGAGEGKPEAAAGQAPPGSAQAGTSALKSRVVLVRDADAVSDAGEVSAEAIERMLDDAVTALLRVDTPAEAWKRLVRPEDTVGIKSNVWKYLPTPPALEEAIVRGVMGAGVPRERIAVDDRSVLTNPVFLKATALINARPLRTHHWSGVGSCIKNYIMFSPDPPSYHDDSCASLGALWDLPAVKGKTRLNVLVMLTPQFHSKGPHNFQKQYTWPYKGILVGTDPVAVDAVGLRILLARRKEHFGEAEPFMTSPKHIEAAAATYRLGVADFDRIELEKRGLQEGILI